MAIKFKTTDLSEAVTEAVKQSTETGYACIILSRGFYFVETNPPLIRIWESLEAQYENGNLITLLP